MPGRVSGSHYSESTMTGLLVFCAAILVSGSYGAPQKERKAPSSAPRISGNRDGAQRSQGVGAFAYQDTNGNRYGGTYDLQDGQVVNRQGDELPSFFNNHVPFFIDNEVLNDFFPEYFRNFEYAIRDAFNYNQENQQIAMDAAIKAFDLTSNQAGYIPDFSSRFSPFPGFQDFQSFPQFPTLGNRFSEAANNAYAFGAIGPDYTQQVAAINPENPMVPNVNVRGRANSMPGVHSVQTSSFSSSMNVNGKEVNHREAETTINDNGKITNYKLAN